MREILEGALENRDAGKGRAQPADRRELPRRFYSDATTAPVAGGHAVLLDGRQARTPGRNPLLVSSPTTAAAMASEWAAQESEIDPASMPLVRLVGSALDAGEERLPALRDEIVSYAGNDLLLYRADTPRELVAEQERHWDGALVLLARHFGVAFQPTVGIVHQPQPAPTLERLADSLRDDALLTLAALVAITTITGSGLLAIALRERLLTMDEVWAAAHVDEDHNIRLWGAVEEAVRRREARRRDFEAAARLLEMLQAERA